MPELIDLLAVFVVDSDGPKEVQVQRYSPGGANVPSWEGTLAAATWRVRLNRPSATSIAIVVNNVYTRWTIGSTV